MSTETSTCPLEYMNGPKFPKPVKELLLWEDVKKSGAVLAGATLVYFLLEKSGYTMLFLIPMLMIVAVIASFVFSFAAKFLGKSSLSIKIPELDDTAARQIASHIQYTHNRFSCAANKVLSGEDMMMSLKVLLVLYLVSQIGKHFRVLTLAYLVVFMAFSVPKIYQMKKTEIDQLLVTAKRQMQEYYKVIETNVLSKLPKSKAASAKTQ